MERREQMALGTLAGAITNAAGQNLGLDVFQIRQDPNRGLTLTAGRYVGSRLFMNLQLPLQSGSRSQQTPGQISDPASSWSTPPALASRRCSRRQPRAGLPLPRAPCLLTARLALAAALLLCGTPLAAQDALSRVGPKTQVRSVEFHFEDSSSLDPEQLREKIALTGQGSMVGLRRRLGFIPFVPPVGAHPFDPAEMARDVVRLRHYYARSGFPKADVAYQAEYHAKSDVVNVTYRIAEGPALTVDTVTFAGAGDTLMVPDSLGRDWRRFTRTEQGHVKRAGEDERRALADSTVRWFRAHGYPFASAATVARVDSAANRADLTVQVASGQRAKVRAIHTTGKLTVPEQEIVHQLPVRAGDWFDAKALEQGRQQLAQTGPRAACRRGCAQDSATDTSVVVLSRMAENPNTCSRAKPASFPTGDSPPREPGPTEAGSSARAFDTIPAAGGESWKTRSPTSPRVPRSGFSAATWRRTRAPAGSTRDRARSRVATCRRLTTTFPPVR